MPPDPHTQDPNWTIDLIWKYLHETTTPGKPAGSWYRFMDPLGTLNDRHYVYSLLVDADKVDHASPDGSNYQSSMIPWNQLHAGIVKAFKTDRACGSVVKIVFMKYMGWSSNEPTSKDVGAKGFDAVKWIEQSLRAGRPIRANLAAAHHYVGIVGMRWRPSVCTGPPSSRVCTLPGAEFLIMDPWVGGFATAKNEILYGGGRTKFLGIARETNGKITYDGYEITSVGGHHPF